MWDIVLCICMHTSEFELQSFGISRWALPIQSAYTEVEWKFCLPVWVQGILQILEESQQSPWHYHLDFAYAAKEPQSHS